MRFPTLHVKHGIDIALLALRLTAGVVFVMGGYGKLFGGVPGMEAFTGMVAGMGFPAPAFFAYMAAGSEFFGGIALILGVFTQLASALLVVTMLVAFFITHHAALPAGNMAFVMLGMVIATLTAGAGRYSMEAVCCKTKK